MLKIYSPLDLGKHIVMKKKRMSTWAERLTARRALLAAVAAFLWLAGPASAADSVPGDACATTNAFMESGGPETSGKQYLMLCNGSTWTAPLMFTSAGTVGIGTTSPAFPLSVISSASISSYGYTTNTGGVGVYGYADAATGSTFGIKGEAGSTSGTGVSGVASAATGTTIGVYGYVASTGSASGVYGVQAGTNNTGYGVRAINSSANGYGIASTGTSPSYFAGNVGIGNAAPSGRLVVSPPAVETIAAAATITVDACGTVKQIDATANRTTNTTNTFTAPAAANTGCCMDVVNTDTTDTITLDANANFKTIGGADVALGPYDAVRVCSNGTNWFQINAVAGNQ